MAQKVPLRSVLIGIFLFFGVMHHLANYWELPARQMLSRLVVLLPIFIGATAFLFRRFEPFVRRVPRLTLAVYLLAATVGGGFLTWRLYRLPASYQRLIITPLNGQVGLIEVKSDSVPISFEKAAIESGWQSRDGVYYAGPEAQSLLLSFKAPANRPITLLFLTSPQGGGVQVKLNAQAPRLVTLSSSSSGQAILRLSSDYRGIAGRAFEFLLVLFSLSTFSTLIFALLMIQDLGQKKLPARSLHIKAHVRNLLLLMALGLGVYSFNALTVPLAINPDTPGYLEGSLHLLKYGNLDRASTYRGPGTTFLFAPVMFLFGNNGWGIKILLHLIAFACLFPAYFLGWQLSKHQGVAFASGLIAVFSPDLTTYASIVMSDVPNIFFVLTFLTLLVFVLQKPGSKWVYLTLVIGSFAVLLRPENLVILAIGILSLLISAVHEWRRKAKADFRAFFTIGLASFIAIVPILWWSAHNQRLHGFFGLSNYFGEAFYDGWVYYGDALGVDFSNPDSPAVQAIREAIKAHPIQITDRKGVPTGWEIYPALLSAGYTPNQAFDVMKRAALDSILNNPALAIEILFNKYQRGLTPYMEQIVTYPLPDEELFGRTLHNEYFYEQALNLPSLIRLRRQIDSFLRTGYPLLYPGWVLFVLLAVFLSLFRAPWPVLSTHVGIVIYRILAPLAIGAALWRFVLPGWLPAQITALSWLWVVIHGLGCVISRNDRQF